MFNALRAAYDEIRARPPAVPPARPQVPSAVSIEIPINVEEPSLVIDVAFGEHHDSAMARERVRTREIIEGLSSLSVVVPTDEK